MNDTPSPDDLQAYAAEHPELSLPDAFAALRIERSRERRAPFDPARYGRRQLTPYDSGEVLEPRVWVDPRTRRAGTGGNRPAEPNDWGKVDFDNDEGATEVVVWVSRGSDGEPELHVYRMDDEPIRVVGDVEVASSESSEASRPNLTIVEPSNVVPIQGMRGSHEDD